MPAKDELRFALQVGSTTKKIYKVMSYAGGGFGVLMPYHRERSGMVAKLPVDYFAGRNVEVAPDSIHAFTASDRVKLSYHPDGFVQFSGESSGKIISGKDADTGRIRGAGIQINRLEHPIRTGPTFSVTVWGPEQFDDVDPESSALLFREEDVYLRDSFFSGDPAAVDGWVFETWVLERKHFGDVRERGGRLTFSTQLAINGILRNVEWLVMDLRSQPVFLATMCSRLKVCFESTSGFHLDGPSQLTSNGKGMMLHACYPFPPEFRSATAVDDPPSLDYMPS